MTRYWGCVHQTDAGDREGIDTGLQLQRCNHRKPRTQDAEVDIPKSPTRTQDAEVKSPRALRVQQMQRYMHD